MCLTWTSLFADTSNLSHCRGKCGHAGLCCWAHFRQPCKCAGLSCELNFFGCCCCFHFWFSSQFSVEFSAVRSGEERVRHSTFSVAGQQDMQFALSPAAPLCFRLSAFCCQLLQSMVVVVVVAAGSNKVVAVVLFCVRLKFRMAASQLHSLAFGSSARQHSNVSYA